ncbi:MAG: glycosyltransferase [Micropepsaceae bacterium]
MKHLIVTAADEAYAPLLQDLIRSLLPHVEKLDTSIACLDLGLAEETRAAVTEMVTHITSPEWLFRPHGKFDGNRKYLSRAARPFLPDYFPGYATYIWIDADAWVQDPRGLQWLLNAAKYSEIAAAPTVHRCYAFQPQDIGWVKKRYEMAFGAAVAKTLMQHSYINSGVMGIASGSRFWKHFRERFQQSLDRWEGDFLSDQAVINGVVAMDNLRLEKLPAQVNWISHLSRPVWDPARQLLAAPSMPFEPIMILHNTFNNKSLVHNLQCLDGKLIETQLTFSAIRNIAR